MVTMMPVPSRDREVEIPRVNLSGLLRQPAPGGLPQAHSGAGRSH
jgi:hypothetical protein